MGIVGKDVDFTVYDDNEVDKYLKLIEGEERKPKPPPKDDEPVSGFIILLLDLNMIYL